MKAISQTSTFFAAAQRHEAMRHGRKRFPRRLFSSVTSSEEQAQIKKLTSQALAWQRSGELDCAEAGFEQALAMAEDAYGLGHHRTAIITLLLSKVCRMNGKSVEAELLRDRAKTMFECGQPMIAPGGSSGFWALLSY